MFIFSLNVEKLPDALLKMGFLLLDKPKGITSFLCLKKLRRLSGLKRVGFLGTLDPLASGLMIFALGEATKLISYLEGGDKRYEAVVELGAVSNTYDGEGEVVVRDVGIDDRPSIDDIKKCLCDHFSGEVMQVPPKFSAIQINGKRAYDMARKGADFEMKKRKVVFHGIEVVGYEWPILRLIVDCGSGTYIRSLAHDLGKELGCGGYLRDLRRTLIREYRLEDAVTFEELEKRGIESSLVSCTDFLPDWPFVNLSEEDYGVLGNGGFLELTVEGDNSGLAGLGILALLDEKCVGVLEKRENKVKFKKKFIF